MGDALAPAPASADSPIVDRGLASRKWIAFLVAAALVAVLTYFLDGQPTALGIGSGAICALYGTYVSGNISEAKAIIGGVVARVLPGAAKAEP